MDMQTYMALVATLNLAVGIARIVLELHRAAE